MCPEHSRSFGPTLRVAVTDVVSCGMWIAWRARPGPRLTHLARTQRSSKSTQDPPLLPGGRGGHLTLTPIRATRAPGSRGLRRIGADLRSSVDLRARPRYLGHEGRLGRGGGRCRTVGFPRYLACRRTESRACPARAGSIWGSEDGDTNRGASRTGAAEHPTDRSASMEKGPRDHRARGVMK